MRLQRVAAIGPWMVFATRVVSVVVALLVGGVLLRAGRVSTCRSWRARW